MSDTEKKCPMLRLNKGLSGYSVTCTLSLEYMQARAEATL